MYKDNFPPSVGFLTSFVFGVHPFPISVSPEEQSGGSLGPRWGTPCQRCHLFLFYLSLTGFPRQDWPPRTPWCRRPSGKKQRLMLAPAHLHWFGTTGSCSSDGSAAAARALGFTAQRPLFQGRQSHTKADWMALEFLARV